MLQGSWAPRIGVSSERKLNSKQYFVQQKLTIFSVVTCSTIGWLILNVVHPLAVLEYFTLRVNSAGERLEI